MIKSKKYVFLTKWKEENARILRSVYPEISNKDIDKFLEKVIADNIKNPTAILHNNYIDKQINTNLLDVINWMENTKPIFGGHGVFYKNQHQVVNPLAVMIKKFLDVRKALKGQLKNIEDKMSYEYQTVDNKQQSEKKSANSIYGVYGNAKSFLFNLYTAPSVTGTGQSLISTTEQAFESFLANNSKFNNIDECFTFINNILDEEYNIDSKFLNNVTVDKLFDRLKGMFYMYNDSYKNIIYPYISSFSQDKINRLYYKNNLYEFSRHTEIIELLSNILGYTKSFKDPNKIPEESKAYLEKLWNYYEQFVLYNHSPINRIQRLKNDYRKVAIIIDTDSNFVNLNPWVEFVTNNIIKTSDTSEEDKFIIVNTMAFVITNMMKCVLGKYTKDANIPKDYRHYINIKNEFFMSRVILASVKKRYLSSIRLREGDEIYPEKLDYKGYDFIKSTSTKEVKNKFTNIIKDHIINTKDIDMVGILHDIKDLEVEIMDSLRNGEKRYLIPVSVKDLEAYKEPLRMQGVRAIIAWNYIYPDVLIDLPAKLDIVKLTLDDDNSLEKLKKLYPDIYKIVDKKILNNPEKAISNKRLPVIAIPRNINEIPKWILDFMDVDTTTYNILSKFYPILSSLYLNPIRTSKQDYFSNILSI